MIFLTKNSPCLLRKGIHNQIFLTSSSELSVVPGAALDCILSLFSPIEYLCYSLRIMENRMLALKPFQAINLEICKICLLRNAEFVQILTAW